MKPIAVSVNVVAKRCGQNERKKTINNKKNLVAPSFSFPKLWPLPVSKSKIKCMSGWRACSRGEFRCENGPCIPEYLRCNGRNDCPYDISDELDCGHRKFTKKKIPNNRVLS